MIKFIGLVTGPSVDQKSDGLQVQLGPAGQVAAEVKLREDRLPQHLRQLGLAMDAPELPCHLLSHRAVAERSLIYAILASVAPAVRALLPCCGGRIGVATTSSTTAAAGQAVLLPALFVYARSVGALALPRVFPLAGGPALGADIGKQLVQTLVCQVRQVAHQQLLNDLSPMQGSSRFQDAMQCPSYVTSDEGFRHS